MAAGRSSSYADRVGRQYEQQFGRPASADDPAYADYIKTALPQLISSDKAALERSQGRWKTADKFAWGAAAIPFAAAAAPLIFGGGASLPAAATQGVGFDTAGTAGAGMNLGRIFGSRGFETAANGITSLFGMRSQNKANKYATDANARLQAEQIAMEQGRIKAQQDADAQDRADAERRWQAEQERAKQAYEQTQEQLAYQRSLSDRQLRLDDEREARRAVYRPYSEAAMRSLGSILRLR
jgi:hypothetical protein